MARVITGRYEIIDIIGQGGMADVYLARDEILNRTVAIKILRTSLAKDPLYVTRFQREASAAAALSHRNIVEIYDVGQDGDEYYIVMEYVPGTTLKELIHKRGAVHYVEAIDILKQVTSGVSRAHKIGIIHRDLKPQNILVTDSGTAKIADFGIASIQSLAQVTQTDVIMGSLHYLAPELARGEKATAQSDVYALGIVLYELLRGEVPFKGESPVNIALKHMREELPSIREFNSSIPQSVENIIIKATAKNPANRYKNAGDMMEDINISLENPDVEKLVFPPADDEDQSTIIASQPSSRVEKNRQVTEKAKSGKINRLIDHFKLLSRKTKIAIGAGVLAVVAIAMVIALTLNGNKKQRMPDLRGMTKEQATNVLNDYGVTISSTINKELSTKYEKGKIIETNPVRGKTITKGQKIILTISTGKYIIVEDYVGMTYTKAKEALTKLGFTVNEEYVISSEAAGTVVNQSLKEGYKQDPNVKNPSITLSVSKGQYIVLESYVGLTYETAKAKLENLGMTVVKKEEQSSTVKAGVVMSQSLRTGTKIDPTSEHKTITLTVSSGYSVTVPNVVGSTVSSATSTLESLGFTVKTKVLDSANTSEKIDASKINVVVAQSITAGTTVSESGKTITLSYYDTTNTD